MAEPQVPPEIVKALPGALGSMVALRWITGTWQQRLSAFIGGSAASYYGTSYMSGLMGTDAGFTGFLLGLFGMALVAKLFEALQRLDIGSRLDRLLTRWGM